MSGDTPSAEHVLEDPAASFWLKWAVQSALERDPADALNDALVLTAILDAHLRAVFERNPG
jgi:hypothetical protein